VVVLAMIWNGAPDAGRAHLEPFVRMGRPIASAIAVQPFRLWQQTFDPLLGPGARNYWKSHNFTELSPAVLAVVTDAAAHLPSPQTEIFFGQLGGALGRVAPDATAYPHRDTAFVMNVHTRWTDAADDARCIEWARRFFDAAAPFATGGVYVNFVAEGEQRAAAAYGVNYPRLARIKRQWDPGNLFRVNQNVLPAPGEERAGEEASAPAPL
jgi:FAD/FMN-containing dehydrogenase